MTTQIRPSSGGAWNSITLTSGKNTSKSTTFGVTLTTPQVASALRACNEWFNAAGTGTAAVRAQKIAKAVGLQLQEV